MEYDVIYSKRRTVSLVIKAGRLVVRAPIGTSRRKINELVESHKNWIEKGIEKTIARAEKEEISPEEEKILRKAARATLPEKTQYYAQKMGLKYGRITITGAKTRFGSCSSKGNISYSFRLMRCPEAAIDYVVVHELAHLLEMNHSDRFWRIVATVFPDYKERRRLLKKGSE
jgi:predicted metal-dependent hydrolase